ncbi:unnamed protein product [Ceutorhynchus assimilis]|uniref:UDP-glucuronosyltransferase n=1 Tax=Ceutorhynchus assimilis TaxID=467358 RepID=A0A9N9MQ83_9CUCU|nr:unnamed protein product [Ceutorhynchus assimilis]
MGLTLILVACLLFPGATLSSRILIYIPLPFYSHQAAYRPLFRELADRGHHLTLLTLNPMQHHENITQIDLSVVYRILEKEGFYEMLKSGEGIELVLKLFDMMPLIADIELSQPGMKEFVEGSGHFDLVITEYYASIGAAFAYKYNCPLIGIMSMDAHQNVHNAVGNPTHPILYPHFDLAYTGKLNFKQRFMSIAVNFIWQFYLNKINKELDRVVIKKYFGENMPPLKELEKKVGMIFINSNPVFHGVRPLTVRTVNVGGGLHIEAQPTPLPEDIKTYLDEASQGVIYFSLGSTVKSSQLSSKLKSVLVNTLSQLPFKVLWKYEDESQQEIVKNILTRSWLPQQAVLRHPNVKLFITQGGLQSLEEALFVGVPVLVMPFFGDQVLNARKVVEYGLGLSLNPSSLEEAELRSTIMEIITTDSYKNSAQRLAKQVSDQPMSGVEKAAWWTEYVLRHPDLELLRSDKSDLPLYQYYFLDILCVCFLVILIFIYLVKFVIGKLLNSLFIILEFIVSVNKLVFTFCSESIKRKVE